MLNCCRYEETKSRRKSNGCPHKRLCYRFTHVFCCHFAEYCICKAFTIAALCLSYIHTSSPHFYLHTVCLVMYVNRKHLTVLKHVHTPCMYRQSQMTNLVKIKMQRKGSVYVLTFIIANIFPVYVFCRRGLLKRMCRFQRPSVTRIHHARTLPLLHPRNQTLRCVCPNVNILFSNVSIPTTAENGEVDW